MGFSFYKPFGWIVTVVALVLLTLFLLAMSRVPTPVLTIAPTQVPTLPPWPTVTPTVVHEDTTPVSNAEPAAVSAVSAQTLRSMTGVVIDESGPVVGATVRLHLNPNGTTTASDGSFTLVDLPAADVFTVTAWAAGYYINWQRVTADDTPVHLQLNPIYTTDNVEYDWFEEDGLEGSVACGTCHTAYTEWQQDAHAQTATNYRFINLYEGTDINGTQSPLTGYTREGTLAPPDLTQPYYGPGFRLDTPNKTGSCAACHTPMAAKLPTNDGCSWSGCHSMTTAQFSTQVSPGGSPLYLYGDAEEGISCEFCHKIGDVRLDPATQTPYNDAPGILSLVLHRPEAGEDVFYGPVDDVVRPELDHPRDSYLPLQQESAFCAGCHHGVMGGVVADMAVTGGVLVYSSYDEWLKSPYSDPETGQSCQDCHMPPAANDYFVFPEKGGQVREHYQVSSHRMLGTNDEAFLQSAVAMTGTATLADGQLQVTVDLTNAKSGHSVPSGSPLRHLLLVVTARDQDGNALALQAGPTLPTWAGNYANFPGQYYAKVLRDRWTGETPTSAYWREIELVEDTRIAALATSTSRYQFSTPAAQSVTIDIQLIYRRAYQQVIEWKSWPDQDIVMAQQTFTVQQ
jgi:hypothetical protein